MTKTIIIYITASIIGILTPYAFPVVFDRIPNIQIKEVIAEGNCIDKAYHIVSILKRRYTGYDRIKVAVGKEHAQVVIQDINNKVRFLKLNNLSIIVSASEFEDKHFFLMDPDKFRKAVEYYRPTVTMEELKKFRDKIQFKNLN